MPGVAEGQHWGVTHELRSFNGQYVSGKKDDIDTNQSSTVTPRQSEELDLFTRVMMPHYVSHEYQYYQHDNYYHGSLSRRRRQ